MATVQGGVALAPIRGAAVREAGGGDGVARLAHDAVRFHSRQRRTLYGDGCVRLELAEEAELISGDFIFALGLPERTALRFEVGGVDGQFLKHNVFTSKTFFYVKNNVFDAKNIVLTQKHWTTNFENTMFFASKTLILT